MSGHHFHLHLSKKKQLTIVDHLANLAAFLAPFMALPQAISIYRGGSTEGVSLATWAGFMVFNAIFFAYGLYHKLRPIIIVNFLWFVIEGAVVVGILINRVD